MQNRVVLGNDRELPCPLHLAHPREPRDHVGFSHAPPGPVRDIFNTRQCCVTRGKFARMMSIRDPGEAEFGPRAFHFD